MKSPQTKFLFLFFWFMLIIQTAIQIYFAIQWIPTYGILGGIGYLFASIHQDPVYAALAYDFIALMIIVGLWVWMDSYRNPKRRALYLWMWIPLYLIIPSLALAIYFLLMNPASSVYGQQP